MAVVDAPEEQIDAYAKRDPRAGQGVEEHDVGLTLFAAAAPDKCWRAAFTLPEIAEIISSDMMIDGHRLTAVTLSEGRGDFTGFAISHRGGLIGFDAAIETLQRWKVRGIVYAPPGENGWRAIIPLSGPREQNGFEIFAARLNGLFTGKLDPVLFKPGHTVTIGGVRHVEVVDGEFLDIADRTYARSIFRDGATVKQRAAAAIAAEKKGKSPRKPSPRLTTLSICTSMRSRSPSFRPTTPSTPARASGGTGASVNTRWSRCGISGWSRSRRGSTRWRTTCRMRAPPAT